VTQTYNNCAETHLVVELQYKPFFSPLFAIARAHDPTVIGSVAPRKGPRRFCPNRSDRCLALMLLCRNLPLWQGCERCNNVFILAAMARSNSINWTAWSSRDMCVNWNESQVSRLQLYEQPSALNDAWVRVVGCKRISPGVQNVRIVHAMVQLVDI